MNMCGGYGGDYEIWKGWGVYMGDKIGARNHRVGRSKIEKHRAATGIVDQHGT